MMKYFVVSDGDQPSQIFFSLEDAKDASPLYIDTFDEDGKFVRAYKRGVDDYTSDF